MKIFIFTGCILLMLAGCNSNLQKIHAEPTNFPEGKEIFISKCGGCHRFYNREHLSNNSWDSILVIMQQKAKLTHEQKNKILLFLKEDTTKIIRNTSNVNVDTLND